jgi:hypothetical protein
MRVAPVNLSFAYTACCTHATGLVYFTHHLQMPTARTPNALTANRETVSLQKLQLITDLVASDPEDMSTIPQVLTDAHHAHYETSLSRHAIGLSRYPNRGFHP